MTYPMDPTTLSQYVYTGGPLMTTDPGMDIAEGFTGYSGLPRNPVAQTMTTPVQPGGFGGLGGLVRGIAGLPISLLEGLGGILGPTQTGGPTGLRRHPSLPPAVNYWGQPIEDRVPSRLDGMQRSPSGRLPQATLNVVGSSTAKGN